MNFELGTSCKLVPTGDGPEKKGGTLENYRYQMDEESYKNAGGCMQRNN